MVHRCDRIIPDLDNRLLPPNAARAGRNLRLGASVGDTNLATTLVNGMLEIEYPIAHPLPAGDNLVIGVREDFESQSVFFALWNSNDDHGIYRIQGESIDLVIEGSILAFEEDSDVSMAIIDGKLYWTDNINQPRMVNIAKGIAGDYPSPLEEWMITQIKRQPGLPLAAKFFNGIGYLTVDIWSKTDISNDFSDSGITTFTGIPFQFSYYYIYDNDEESTIAPFSTECYYTKQIQISIPQDEYNAYLLNLNLVKQIVYLYRQGNDGVWYVIKSVDNVDVNSYSIVVDDLLTIPKVAVSSDIVDRSFDAVPLLATSNEIAQNRITLSNYLIDYPTVDTLTLTATAVAATYDANINAQVVNKIHKPGGTYNVGVELLDEWGRRIGVVNQVPVTIPTYENFAVQSEGNDVPENENRDWEDNSYWIDWELTGTVPSWVKYYRVVESTAVRVVRFHRMTTILLYWYQGENGQDYLSRFYLGEVYRQSDTGGPFTEALDFFHKGYAIFLPTESPINFVKGDETYVTIIGSYAYELGTVLAPFDFANYGEGREYKVDKQVNNALYIKLQGDILDEPDFPFSVNYGLASSLNQDPMYFGIEVTTKTTTASEIYYQNENVFTDITGGAISATGTLYGDAYLTRFKKIFNPWFTPYIDNFQPQNTTDYISYITDPNASFPFRGNLTFGVYVAMNPTDIYSQDWNPQQGQESVVNERQEQVRVENGIAFSSALIQGTQINGLSKFNSLDLRQAPLENGPITALVRTSATQREPGVLLAIGKNGVSSFYYDGIQLTNVDGTANVSTSDKYLASQRPLVGNYGAEKLRNICATPLGTVYYWSEGIRDWIRYTNAGLEQLGETYQFMNFLRNQLSNSDSVFVTYDQVTDEAILVGNNSSGYVFSERFKTFQPARDYAQGEPSIRPERGATLSTRTFFFLKGRVWQMGSGLSAQPNRFFDEVKNPELTIITNVEPTVVKRWNQIVIFGPSPIETELSSEAPEGTDDDVLSSYILPGWWIPRKWSYEAAIKTSVDDDAEVMNGRIMESRLLISTFVWSTSNFVKLNYIEVKATRSPVQ